MLRRLEEAGVGVPSPIEARRRDGHWELVTACVEDAVPLAGVLSGATPPPTAAGSIARSVARLIASAHAAGLDHPDLHPGNLLVQPDGRAWIVDVRGARVNAGDAATNLRRDLVALASGTRERSTPWTRARFLLAYLRALEPRLAASLPERRALADEIERAARIHRREGVRRARLRWTRLSSVCSPVDETGLAGFRAVEVDDERALLLAAELRGGAATFPIPWSDGERAIVVRGVGWRKLLSAWFAAARLVDHAITSARPLALARAPERCAVFAVPVGARPLRADEERRAAEIHDRLRDRGLVLVGAYRQALLVAPDGRIALGPLVGAGLADFDG